MIFKVLFYSFLIYLVYRLIFNFIIPIYRTTKQVKRGFKNMQDQMRQQQQEQQPDQPKTAPKKDKNQVGEYIDFEEVE